MDNIDDITSAGFEERKEKAARAAQAERRQLLIDNPASASSILEQITEYALVRLHQEHGKLGDTTFPIITQLPKTIADYIFKELGSIYGITTDIETKVLLTPPMYQTLTLSISIKDPEMKADVIFENKGGVYGRVPNDPEEEPRVL